MAKFTASEPLNIRLPGGFEAIGAVGTTYRIPDSLVEEFARDQAPLIPGFAWVTQDETTGLAISADVTTQIAASITAHSNTSSIKVAAAVHGSADVTQHISQVFSTTGNEAHVNSTAFDGRTIVTGSFSAGKVWVSHDFGMTWQDIGQLQSGVDDLQSIIAVAPGVFFAGCSRSGSPASIHRSTDGGHTWLQIGQPDTSATEGFALEGGFGRTLLAGTGVAPAGRGVRVYRSTDWGNTWTLSQTLDTSKTILRKIAHIANNIYILGAYGSSPNECKVYRSTDSGVTWTAIQTIGSTDIYEITALPSGTVLLGTHPDGYIYRSTDIGQTFTTVAKLTAGTGQVFGLTHAGGHAYAFVNNTTASTSTVWVSDDDGLTWTQIGTLSFAYHYHEPVAIDHRTFVVGAAGNSGGSAGVRITIYG